jgi:uncharacterized protein YkwD
VHHLPEGPSRSDRPRRLPRLRRRHVLVPLVAGVLAGVLAVATPVLSAADGASPAALDSTASAGTGAVVVMGVDGAPAAGTSSAGAASGSQHTGSAGGTATRAATGAPSGGAVSSTATAATADKGTDPVPTSAGTATAAGAGTGSPQASSSAPDAAPGGPSTSADPAPVGSPSPTDPSPSSTADPASQSGPGTSSPAAAVDRSAAVVAAVQGARAHLGCDPLTVDDGLAAVAARHAGEMAAGDALTVTGLGGRPAVVAQGPADAAGAVAGWLGSDADASVLLDCGLTRLGAAEQPDGPWWTAVLG